MLTVNIYVIYRDLFFIQFALPIGYSSLMEMYPQSKSLQLVFMFRRTSMFVLTLDFLFVKNNDSGGPLSKIYTCFSASHVTLCLN